MLDLKAEGHGIESYLGQNIYCLQL